MVDINALRVGSVVLGFGSHAIFNRHEPSLFQFVSLLALGEAGLFWLWNTNPQLGRQALLRVMGQCSILYFCTLATSIAIYRLYLHPLSKYPGPVLGKLTKFYTSYYGLQGKIHLWLEDQHAKYGEIVRYGPNELSLIDPADVAYVQGGRSIRMLRGPWYDGSPEMIEDSLSMARTRHVDAHKFRRRIWEQAFTQPALKSYEPKVNILVDQVVQKCLEKQGEILDIGSQVDHFAVDAMGMLGFNRDYGMISGQNVESKDQMRSLGDYMKMLGITRPVPWFKYLYRVLPIDAKGKNGLVDFVTTTTKRFDERYEERETPIDDILYYLMLPESKSGVKMTRPELIDEAVSVVIAGSDTTSICLSFALYYLLKSPDAYKKLVNEIDRLWDGHSLLEARALVPSQAPYLEGVINESLRLAEPDPNGNQRQTPKGGFFVGDKYIPEFTQLSVHKWTMQRYHKNFSRPLEFLPERWISDEERSRLNVINHSPKGFIPFGAGQYGCVGKQLALMEMRLFLVGFLRRVSVLPAPGYDLDQFPNETRSHLTLITPDLPVLIKSRKL